MEQRLTDRQTANKPALLKLLTRVSVLTTADKDLAASAVDRSRFLSPRYTSDDAGQQRRGCQKAQNFYEKALQYIVCRPTISLKCYLFYE